MKEMTDESFPVEAVAVRDRVHDKSEIQFLLGDVGKFVRFFHRNDESCLAENIPGDLVMLPCERLGGSINLEVIKVD